MNKLFKVGVCCALAIGIAGCQNMSKQTGGVLAGGTAGALLGSRFGSGSGQVLATAAGAVLGGLIGGTIGNSMDKADAAQMQNSLNSAPTGQASTWRNPDTGNVYTVKPTRTYQKKSSRTHKKQYCREYQTTATIAGKKQQTYGTACRQPDGSWKMVS